jgi:hypothetical protein
MFIVQTVISISAKVIFISGMALFVVAFYQQSMFVREWYEDHAPAGSWAKRGLLSTEAIFYPSLSERCRRRRRQLVTALGGAFLFVPIAVFLERLVE